MENSIRKMWNVVKNIHKKKNFHFYIPLKTWFWKDIFFAIKIYLSSFSILIFNNEDWERINLFCLLQVLTDTKNEGRICYWDELFSYGLNSTPHKWYRLCQIHKKLISICWPKISRKFTQIYSWYTENLIICIKLLLIGKWAVTLRPHPRSCVF